MSNKLVIAEFGNAYFSSVTDTENTPNITIMRNLEQTLDLRSTDINVITKVLITLNSYDIDILLVDADWFGVHPVGNYMNVTFSRFNNIFCLTKHVKSVVYYDFMGKLTHGRVIINMVSDAKPSLMSHFEHEVGTSTADITHSLQQLLVHKMKPIISEFTNGDAHTTRATTELYNQLEIANQRNVEYESIIKSLADNVSGVVSLVRELVNRK